MKLKEIAPSGILAKVDAVILMISGICKYRLSFFRSYPFLVRIFFVCIEIVAFLQWPLPSGAWPCDDRFKGGGAELEEPTGDESEATGAKPRKATRAGASATAMLAAQ